MKKVTITAIGLSMLASMVFAAQGDINIKKCMGCHGANFEKKALGKSKVVKDMTPEEIKKALKGYKDGTYGGPMKGLMKGQVANVEDTDKLAEAVSEHIAKTSGEK